MLGTLAFLTCMSCTSSQTNPSSGFIGENVDFARTQLGLAIDTIEASGKCLNPVTLNKDGKVYYCGYADWRSGFFPGRANGRQRLSAIGPEIYRSHPQG